MASADKHADYDIRVCKTCDYIIKVPKKAGFDYSCPCCGTLFHNHSIEDLEKTAFVSVSALIIIIVAIFEPFLSVDSMGMSHTIRLFSITEVLKVDWSILLYILLIFSFIFPIVMLSIISLLGFFKLTPSVFVARIYSFAHGFCMVDVFILGVLISLIKLTGLANVSFHTGFVLSMLFSIMLVWSYIKCPPSLIWNLVKKSSLQDSDVGKRAVDVSLVVCEHCRFPFYSHDKNPVCPRCHKESQIRKKDYKQRVFALLIATIILYLPSNVYPIMYTDYLGNNIGSNIIEGVIALWDMGSFFVAAVILIASIFIPIFKIISIAFLVFMIKYKKIKRPKRLCVLYKIVSFIGKWSMIDVFVVIIMTSVVRFTGFLVINPGLAIISFCSVVLITMFAAESFDERLIWDNALNGRD